MARFGELFSFDYQGQPADVRLFGLRNRAFIRTRFANATFPDSLLPGDRNLVVDAGTNCGARLVLEDSKWMLAPCVSLNVTWVNDGNDYNKNKIRPVAGSRCATRCRGQCGRWRARAG